MTDIQPYQGTDNIPTIADTPGTMALLNLEQQAKAMGNAMKIAEAMCSTSMVPKAFKDKPADGAAAILYGAELGMSAIQSLQQVMVINGKPGIEARTAVGLLKSRGYRFDTVESSAQSVTVRGTSPTGEVEICTWDIARATQAGYLNNQLYKKIPEQMLYAKAAMEVCRKLAPHVLSGIAYSVEELQLEPLPMRAERQDRGLDGVRAVLAEKQQPPAAAIEEKPAETSLVDQLIADIGKATSREDLDEIMAPTGRRTELSDADDDLVRDAAMKRLNEIGG